MEPVTYSKRRVYEDKDIGPNTCWLCRVAFDGREVKECPIVISKCGHRTHLSCADYKLRLRIVALAGVRKEGMQRQIEEIQRQIEGMQEEIRTVALAEAGKEAMQMPVEEIPPSSIPTFSCDVCHKNPFPFVRETGALIKESSFVCESLPLRLCRERNGEALKKLLNHNPQLATYGLYYNAVTRDPKVNLLEFCGMNGVVDCVAPLIQAQPGICESGYLGVAVLFAARNGHFSTLKVLIESGARNYNYESIVVNENNALTWALRNNHIECAKFLIRSGMSIDYPVCGTTARDIAITLGSFDRLLPQGGSIRCTIV